MRILIAADADLQQIDRLVSQVLEMMLVMGSVVMA
jgi:hypothetical protein